jgi:hypothetical protein
LLPRKLELAGGTAKPKRRQKVKRAQSIQRNYQVGQARHRDGRGCHESGDIEVVAVITRDSFDKLGLKSGDAATAVIKATEVMIAKD